MPRTKLSGGQLSDSSVSTDIIADSSVRRADLNVSTAGSAVIAKVVQGTGIAVSSTGADAGTGDVTVSLSTSGVSAGTYRNVTVDVYGRVTGGTNPTTLAGYGITDALALSGGTVTGTINMALSSAITFAFASVATTGLDMGNRDIVGINKLAFYDTGPNEGIEWASGNLWKIYESPNDLTTNSAGNLHIVQNSTRRATFNTSGQFELPVATGTAPMVIASTTRVANLNVATAGTADTWTTARTITIGSTGKSVNGSGNVSWTIDEIGAEYRVPTNSVRTNLGNPTVREMALFHGQFNNKFRFIPPTSQEESTDGTTWTASSRASAANLADMMIGEGQSTSFNIIPTGTVGSYGGYRLTWNVTGQTGYVFLDALYIYSSTNGNNITVKIERFHNTNGWETVASNLVINGWPGHAFIPHTSTPYSTASSQYSQVRITFESTHNSNTNAYTLYGIEWFGGYPAGRRNVEYYDSSRNVYFPAAIQGGRFVSTVATGTAPLTVTSTTAVTNLNADLLDGNHASAFALASHTHTTSDISNLSIYTGFDARYFTESESDARFVALAGSYANPTWITSLAWAKITGAPTTYAPSAHTHAYGDLTGIPTTFAPSAHSLDSHSNVTITSNTAGEILKWDGTAWINNTLFEAGIQPAGSYALASHTHTTSDISNLSSYTGFDSRYPLQNGTGASGTWNINISGNAATATSADQIDGQPFRNTTANSMTNPDTIESNGISYTGVSLLGQSDGALYSQAYSSAWQHQIFGDYRTGQIAVRGKNSGTWQAWRTIIDSGNYTSYSPSLTGTGASGTWGINITGNAATASNLVNGGGVASAAGGRYITIDSTNDWAFLRLSKSGVTIWDIAQQNGGALEFRYQGSSTVRYLMDGSGVFTSYAVSTSIVTNGVNQLQLRGGGEEINLNSGTFGPPSSNTLDLGSSTARWDVVYANSINVTSLAVSGTSLVTNLNADLLDGYDATVFVQNSDNVVLGTGSSGTFEFIHATGAGGADNDFVINNPFQAWTFRALETTSLQILAGTTVRATISAGGIFTINGANNISLNSSTGIVGAVTANLSSGITSSIPSFGNISFSTNTNTYGAWLLGGVKNAYTGISFDVPNIPNVIFSSSNGSGGMYYQTGNRWVFYHDYANNRTGIGGISTTAGYAVQISGGTYLSGNSFVLGSLTVSSNLTVNNNLSVVGSIDTGGSFAANIRANLSGNQTLAATDHTLENTGAAATYTLPAASTCTRRIYCIINHGTGAITTSIAYRTANATTTTTIAVGARVIIQSDGAEWLLLAN